MADVRMKSLDGWRGISIALVLAGHLLPLGPGAWQLNAATAGAGMAVFFILSGFLITTLLLKDPRVGAFLTRRLLRILPLAWLAMVIVLSWRGATPAQWLRHLTFTANWEPMALGPATGHLWSLCVEIQFYLTVALLVGVAGRRGLWLLPLLALIVTALRIGYGKPTAINTLYRVDEILAGCTLALLYTHQPEWARRLFSALPLWGWMALVLASAHPRLTALNYLRPYLAMAMIGATLLPPAAPPGAAMRGFMAALQGRTLAYLATISYALYVVHGCLGDTWLGTGATFEKYAKRPLMIGLTFVLAHLSTFYYESHFMAWGKRLTRRA